MIRWWRKRRCLRHIADLEVDLGLHVHGWWALVRIEWYDMEGGGGFYYRMPDLERRYRKAVCSSAEPESK